MSLKRFPSFCTCARLVAILAAGTGVAQAADRYEGTAFDRSGHVAYRETHWRYAEDGTQRRLVLYRCADGSPFARKQMHWVSATEASPDFDFLDQRDGYREGLVSSPAGRQVYWQPNAAQAQQRKPVRLGTDAVADAGFDSFIRRHWDALSAGRSIRTAFLLPADFDLVPVVIRLAQRSPSAGRSSDVTFSIELDRWYAFAAPGISVTYDRDGRSLREFDGAVTIRDYRGRRQVARVEFLDSGRGIAASPDDIAAAIAAPLVARCAGS
jgi:hypothetical protein